MITATILALATSIATVGTPREHPNVLLIITDDQGYGDLSIHGNPVLMTPNLDRIGKDGMRFGNFHVSPVCSPTRASLLTGRYHYRTGVVDTFLGRSLMHADETTLAEALAAAGYRTGIFGKWHLGDNYPLRPIDQGFGEALVLKGGGIGQPSDPPGGTSYFDPILQHNGRPEAREGYITDIITDAAIGFVEAETRDDPPFFAYVAYNAPHTPLEVEDADLARFRDEDLSADRFPKVGQPLPDKLPIEATARVYGMVANIDANVGRLLDTLDRRGLARDTIVVFLTDNGPQQPRYNGGLRDRKGSVYDGGIRVPCFVRWPGRIEAGRVVDRIAAHIDLMPTLLDACDVPRPGGVKFDGVSLLPFLLGEPAERPERTLFFQWHRGELPELGRAFAARNDRYKLVRPEGGTDLQLYDMQDDPYEMHDLAADHPEARDALFAAYRDWFEDVRGERGFVPPRIVVGDPREPVSVLTRQDWRGPRAGWTPKSLGHWEIAIARAGTYDVTLHFGAAAAAAEGATARVAFISPEGGLAVESSRPLDAGATTCTIGGLRFAAPGPRRLEARIEDADEASIGVAFLEVARSGD